MTQPHSNIILSLFSIALVLKCAAKKKMKIGLQIKIKRPKMFLNSDFCTEKLLTKEGNIFSEKKNKSFNILLKMHKTNTK